MFACKLVSCVSILFYSSVWLLGCSVFCADVRLQQTALLAPIAGLSSADRRGVVSLLLKHGASLDISSIDRSGPAVDKQQNQNRGTLLMMAAASVAVGNDAEMTMMLLVRITTEGYLP